MFEDESKIKVSTPYARGTTEWAGRITYEGKRVFFSACEVHVLVRPVHNARLGMCLDS